MASPAPASAKAARKARKDEAREGIDASMIVSAEMLAATALKADFLNKRSEQGVIHNWKRRWVVLNGNLLYYFESPESKKPQGVIVLDGSSVNLKVATKLKSKPECIVITTRAERIFYFAGANTYENASWLEVLKSVPGVLTAGSVAADIAAAAPGDTAAAEPVDGGTVDLAACAAALSLSDEAVTLIRGLPTEAQKLVDSLLQRLKTAGETTPSEGTEKLTELEERLEQSRAAASEFATEKDMLAVRLSLMEQENVGLARRITDIESERSTLQSKLIATESNSASLSDRLESLQAQISADSQSKRDASSEAASLAGEHQALRDELISWQAKAEAAAAEVNLLRTRVKDAEVSAAKFRGTLSTAEGELKLARSQHADAIQDVQRRTQLTESLQADVQAVKDALSESEKSRSALRAQLETSSSELRLLHRKMEATEKDKTSAALKASGLEKEVAALKASVDSLTAAKGQLADSTTRFTELQTSHAALTSKATALEDERNHLAGECRALQFKVDEQQASIASLREQLATISSSNDEVRHLVQKVAALEFDLAGSKSACISTEAEAARQREIAAAQAATLAVVQSQLKAAQEQQAHAEAVSSQHRAALSSAETANHELVQECTLLRSRVAEFTAELSACAAARDEAQAQSSNFASENADVRAKLLLAQNDAHSRQEDMSRTIDLLRTELQNLRHQLADAISSRETLSAKVASTSAENAELLRERLALLESNTKLARESAEANAQLRGIRENSEIDRARLHESSEAASAKAREFDEKAAAEARQLHEQVAQLREQVLKLEGEAKRIAGERASALSDAARLRAAIASLTMENDGIRSELEEYYLVCDQNKEAMDAWKAKTEELEEQLFQLQHAAPVSPTA